jgi:hypothetical protein
MSFATFTKTKLKRKSINTYFQERCTGGQKSKHFYTTVKPFLSKKSTGSQQKSVLVENDKIFCIWLFSSLCSYTVLSFFEGIYTLWVHDDQ